MIINVPYQANSTHLLLAKKVSNYVLQISKSLLPGFNKFSGFKN